MPDDEGYFPLNTTFRVQRTTAVPGTGTSKENPREGINMATAWMDLSPLYGSTQEVAQKLRSFSDGKLLTQELQSRGQKTKASYLPFNTMDAPMQGRHGVASETLFAGGDPRTNEDWMLLGVHTLLLREHNRLCDILARQHPEYDDEQLYQTIRLVMSSKLALIGNAYQISYWSDKMPWPREDGMTSSRDYLADLTCRLRVSIVSAGFRQKCPRDQPYEYLSLASRDQEWKTHDYVRRNGDSLSFPRIYYPTFPHQERVE